MPDPETQEIVERLRGLTRDGHYMARWDLFTAAANTTEAAEQRIKELEGALGNCWGEAYLLLQGERTPPQAAKEIIREARSALSPAPEEGK